MGFLLKKYNGKYFGILFMLALVIGMVAMRVEAATVEDRMEDFIEYNARPEKIAYLTFDDGPSKYTTELIKVLEDYDISAIFFVLGESIENVPNSDQLLNQLLEEGHHIGFHSMTHNRERLYFRSDSPQIFVQEMLEVKQLVYEMTGGYETDLCRAPYGKNGHFQVGHWTAVEEAGLYCIDWNVDSLDWSKKSTGQIYNQVVKELESEKFPDQVVLLFHEKKLTAEVLPSIIEYIQSEGYTFVPYIEGETIEVLN